MRVYSRSIYQEHWNQFIPHATCTVSQESFLSILLPPSLHPSLPPFLPPSLPPSILPSLPSSILPSLPLFYNHTSDIGFLNFFSNPSSTSSNKLNRLPPCAVIDLTCGSSKKSPPKATCNIQWLQPVTCIRVPPKWYLLLMYVCMYVILLIAYSVYYCLLLIGYCLLLMSYCLGYCLFQLKYKNITKKLVVRTHRNIICTQFNREKLSILLNFIQNFRGFKSSHNITHTKLIASIANIL